MAFGLSLGTRQYFIQNNLQESFTGTCTSLLFNTTGEASADVNDGVVVSGMCNARITGNISACFDGTLDP